MILLIKFTNGIASLIVNEDQIGEINNLIENFTGSAEDLLGAIESNFDAIAKLPSIIKTNISIAGEYDNVQ